MNLRFNTSFLNNFINKAIGVTITKKIIPITNGETIFPSKIPNLNHKIFRGVKSLELIRPNIKKIKERNIAHNLYASWFNKGQNAIIIKNIKKLFQSIYLNFFLISY